MRTIRLFRTFFLLFLALIGFSCEKWKLAEENFIQAEITGLDSLAIDSVRISGLIRGLKSGQLRDHGFVWTTQEAPPEIFFNEGSSSLGIKTKDEEQIFSETLKLEPNTRYLFRAYATLDKEEYHYSESFEYRTGSAEVLTLGIDYQQGLSLEVSGRLSGTEKGLVALKHGFCWSTTDMHPTLEDDFVDLGIRRNNNVFTYTANSLQADTPYHFRAYAIFTLSSFNFRLDTIFGQAFTFDGDLQYSIPKRDFGGEIRRFAVGFAIGDKGYIGTGSGLGGLKKDLWEYDPQTDSWSQKADFGGGERYYAVGFSIGQKGYIGTGLGEDSQPKGDFWEYDPQTDSWAQKADLGGGIRTLAIGFSIGQKGYIGTGTNVSIKLSDFWEYDPQIDSWSQKVDFSGGGRTAAVGFSNGLKGYIGTGSDVDYQLRKDFWEYDPQTDSWAQKADFEGGERTGAVGFAIGQKGYIGTGHFAEKHKDIWEYDPLTDTWAQRLDFGGEARSYAVGFAIGDKGYIGTGDGDFSDFNDFWNYFP
ncbi:MAG: hypothetical protein H6560_05825 [Lewinellaceae bacterium]|nr:hypothetical protein [Lewinellaceae bacterium]